MLEITVCCSVNLSYCKEVVSSKYSNQLNDFTSKLKQKEVNGFWNFDSSRIKHNILPEEMYGNEWLMQGKLNYKKK